MNAHTDIERLVAAANHFHRHVVVPFTALRDGDDLFAGVPVTGLVARTGRLVMGVSHSFYVVPQTRMTYKEEELARLGAFVAEQDAQRMATSAVFGGFEVPVALIAKLHHRTSDYAFGKRWAFYQRKADGTVLTTAVPSLEHLMTRLGRL